MVAFLLTHDDGDGVGQEVFPFFSAFKHTPFATY